MASGHTVHRMSLINVCGYFKHSILETGGLRRGMVVFISIRKQHLISRLEAFMIMCIYGCFCSPHQ